MPCVVWHTDPETDEADHDHQRQAGVQLRDQDVVPRGVEYATGRDEASSAARRTSGHRKHGRRPGPVTSELSEFCRLILQTEDLPAGVW